MSNSRPVISEFDYNKIRNVILGRIKRTSAVLRQTRPEQVNLRNALIKQRETDRRELAKWEAQYKQQNQPAPMDSPFYEEPCRQLDRAA